MWSLQKKVPLPRLVRLPQFLRPGLLHLQSSLRRLRSPPRLQRLRRTRLPLHLHELAFLLQSDAAKASTPAVLQQAAVVARATTVLLLRARGARSTVSFVFLPLPGALTGKEFAALGCSGCFTLAPYRGSVPQATPFRCCNTNSQVSSGASKKSNAT